MKPDIGECSDEAWRQFVQFTGVIAGEVIENLAAFARDAEDYDALVVGIGGAGEQALIFGSVNEFDNAVVFKPETRGGISNAYGDRFGGSGNLQEELMLLRLESGGKGGTLGEMKKTAQLKAEVSECAEQVRFGGGWGETHIYIVSRHKLNEHWRNCLLKINGLAPASSAGRPARAFSTRAWAAAFCAVRWPAGSGFWAEATRAFSASFSGSGSPGS
jgi:hypothetical protein